MKKILLALFFLLISGCFISEQHGYIDYRQRRMYDWDPIYYVPGFYDPFFYRSPRPIIIYRDRRVPIPRPQEPRRYNFNPQTPSYKPNNGGSNAPIRKFPNKKHDK